MNIMMLLEMARGAFPERIAFTDGSSGQTLTYAQLFEAARSRAASVKASEGSDASFCKMASTFFSLITVFDFRTLRRSRTWWAHQDSNLGPAD